MANEWITWVLKEAPLDDPTETFVLMVLADSSNTDGVTWPNKKTLASYTRLTPRSIARVIASLEEKTLVKRTARFNNGEQTSNYYQLYQRTRAQVEQALKDSEEKRKQGDGMTPMTSPHDAHDIPPMTPMTSLGVSPMTYQEPKRESSVEPKENQKIAPLARADQSPLDHPDPMAGEAEHSSVNGKEHSTRGDNSPKRKTQNAKDKDSLPKSSAKKVSAVPSLTSPASVIAESATTQTPKVNAAAALGEAYGVPPVGKRAFSKYGEVASALNEATIPTDEFKRYVDWTKRESKNTGNWTVTITSLMNPERMSKYVQARNTYNAQQASKNKPALWLAQEVSKNAYNPHLDPAYTSLQESVK